MVPAVSSIYYIIPVNQLPKFLPDLQTSSLAYVFPLFVRPPMNGYTHSLLAAVSFDELTAV